jgi:acyl-CoA dehydrogenase
MSERSLLDDAVAELFGARCTPEDVVAAEAAGWAPELWRVTEDLGLPLASVPEALGGTGGSLADDWSILRAAGRHAVPLPLVETGLVGGWLLAGAGLEVPAGPMAVAEAREHRGTLSGRAANVPWASTAQTIVTIATAQDGARLVAAVPRDACRVEPGLSVAGEPLDVVGFDGVSLGGVAHAPLAVEAGAVRRRGALGYAVLMLGALERTRDLTIEYTRQREQFGRPISRFQAVQHHVAQIARDVAVTRGAVELAMAATEAAAEPPALEVAVAKIQCGKAAQSVAARAHQVHGAIGITKEYPLHLFTRRLWAWRDLYGSEQEWARAVGELALDAGADLWPLMTSTYLDDPGG